MKRDVEFLKSADLSFDCIVIGGGIQGAGIAREASLQGLKVLLVDRGDFASGTSSRSTKLIHGGLRYLEQGNFKLVKESLAERKVLMRMAPHLVRPLPFLFPVYQGDRRGLWQIRLGLKIYDALAKENKIQPHENWAKDSILKSFPEMSPKKLAGGLVYWDAQMDDSRLCLEVLKSAFKLGCHVMNYMRVTGFVKTGEKISSVQLKDLKTGEIYEIQGKIFINATGIRADEIRQMAEPDAKKRLRWSKGVHLVTKRLFAPESASSQPLAIVRPTSDGRIFFVLPWVRGTTLIGTTDTDYANKPSECYSQKEDVEYLYKEFQTLFPSLRLKRNDFYVTFSGLRALINNSSKKATSALSREYEIEELGSGLLSILGGKYTTFRSLSVKVVEKVFKILNLERRYDDTRYLSLDGSFLEDEVLAKKRIDYERRSQSYGLSPEAREHLWSTYGTNVVEIFKLLDYDPTLKSEILPERFPHFPIKAEIVYAIKDEMSLTLTDFLRRRSQLFFSVGGGLDVLDSVALVYQDYLHWSDEEIEKQKQDYRQEVARNTKALDQVFVSQNHSEARSRR